MTGTAQIVRNGAEQGNHIGRPRGLALRTLHEGHVAFEHPLHLAHVFLQRLHRAVLLQQRKLQLEPCKDGAQVMAHPRQHGGALLHVALDAPLHLDKRIGGRLHLRGAAWPEIGHVTPHAKALRRIGQPHDGPDLVAQEDNGDCEQNDRAAKHPCEENLPGRGVRPVHVRQEPEHEAVCRSQPHIDITRLPHRIHPLGHADPFSQVFHQLGVNVGQERLLDRRRQLGIALHGQAKRQPVIRQNQHAG